MPWLITAISAYFLFAIVALVDKYLLGGLMPSPKIYAFYVGVLGILILLIIPFVDFLIPGPFQILLAFFAGIIHILAIFVYFSGLKKFETSRIVPAIGGLSPLFVFGLTYMISGGRETLSLIEGIAFLLLVSGSVLVTWERSKNISFKSIRISIIAAFLFALYFTLVKLVYLEQSFISGFIWTRIGAFFIAIIFLFSKEIKEEIFTKRQTFNVETWGIFLPNATAAAVAFILQNWAIALAGIASVALISALAGTQYVFVLIFVIVLSFKFPKILKEEISKEVILQKISSILLIGAGLAILTLK